MKRKAYLLLLFTWICTIAWSQNKQVTGHVTKDNSTEALAGVTVSVKGANNRTTTNNDGDFTISVPDGKNTLVFTYIGHKALEVNISGKSNVEVKMQEEATTLNDVVVVGYATVKRKDLTGSVASVSAKDVKDIPLNSAAEAITGRLAGVQVVTTEGRPGADIQIRVRGGGSITQDNSPLYIVDGIQVENALSLLSPQEIQSIDVLKDAAATAIYGARGANGVVVITTKGGRDMKTKVSYDAYVGVRKITNTLPVMNPYDFAQYQYQLYNYNTDQGTKDNFRDAYGRWEDLDIYRNMPFTNWQDEVFGRTAWNKTHTVGITGGSKTSSFNLNISNTNEDGIMLNSGFKRTLASFKFDHTASDKLKVGFNTRYSRQRVDGVGTSNTGSQTTNRLRNTIRYKPFEAGTQQSSTDVFDPDYYKLTNLTNPVLLANNELKYDYRNDLNLNGYASYDFIKNLTFKTVVGITNTDARANTYNGAVTAVAQQNSKMPVVNITTGNIMTVTNSNTLSYKTRIKKAHDVDFLVGQEIYQTLSKNFNSTVKYLPVDLTPEQAFAGIQKATPPSGLIQDAPTTFQSESRLLSFFGRANYNYKSKYLATATMRYDGSSKFAYENGFAAFPSVSLGWVMSKEKFLENVDALSFLKMRLSVGTSGNNRIDNDLFKTMFGTSTSSYAFDEAVTPGFAPMSLANPFLRWETTIARNLGFDFGFFKGRINGSVDLYDNTTKDLLLKAKVPNTSGWTEQLQNIGKTQNKGVELQLSANVIKTKDFNWTANFNIAHNENKVISLGKDASGQPLQGYTIESGWVNSLRDFSVEVGKPIGQFYGYVTDGFYTVDDFDATYNASTNAWTYKLKSGVTNSSGVALGNKEPQPGDLKLKKLSKDSSMLIGANDMTVLGNAQPKLTGGFNQQFTYKNFDFSVFMNFSYGNKVYNANKIEFTTAYQYKDNNLLTLMNDRWKWYDENGQKVTDPEALKALNANTKYWTPPTGNYFLHSFAIEDGSFLRISNVTLGYSLPDQLLKRTHVFTRLRVYATVNNLYTFTKYSGFDPEANTRRSNPLTPSVDYAAYPRSRFTLVGVNVTF